MSELDSTTQGTENNIGPENRDPEQNAEYLADAYEALADDRRQQQDDLTGPQHSSALQPQPADLPLVADAGEPVVVDETGDPPAETPSETVAESAAPDDAGVPPTGGRRVFVIDGKEYPDPDQNLPITGARSVQAMYRDYFPGQLDNADVAQKTRPDGTLEVTFKRRIGTKGARGRGSASAAGPGEVVITIARVVSVLAALPEDRPLAWDLVEQAMGPKGTVRLDYVPPATQLNLAEAQQASRARLIELAVGELRRLRPSA